MTGVVWGPGAMRAWRAWARWCAATGHEPIPASAESVALFCEQMPAARSTLRYRISTICRAHREAGYGLVVGEPYQPQQPWRTGPGWAGPGEALERCPVDGWPGGLHGRRDGWLIVCCGVLGLSREQARAVRAEDIEDVHSSGPMSVAGQVVPVHDNPRRCPACAVARWLELVGELDFWGRSSAKNVLHKIPHGHQCGVPVGDGPWQHVPTLLPAVDQWGWTGLDERPLSARSISAVLAVRQRLPDSTMAGPSPDTDSASDVLPHDPTLDALGMDEVLALLDERTAAAEAVLARVNAALNPP